MPPTCLIVPLLPCVYIFLQQEKQLPEMRKFAANVMELAKKTRRR